MHMINIIIVISPWDSVMSPYGPKGSPVIVPIRDIRVIRGRKWSVSPMRMQVASCTPELGCAITRRDGEA